jgi:AcrR family transcriptional regulator
MAAQNRLRRDVERNHEAIVTAAIAVLADTSEATMAEIAAASGIGRSTLYRHFPDRRSLIAAIYARVFAEAGEIVRARLDPGVTGDPIEVLVELVISLAGLGDRYRFLVNYEEHLHAKEANHDWRRRMPLRSYIDRAQAAGTLRDDLPADWLSLVLGRLIAAAARHQFADAQARRASVEATVRSLLTPA